MTTFTYQERFRTEQGVFDEFTQRNLFELQSRNIFDELVSPLEVGKESNVFIASQGKKKVIVKIYRVQNCDFKRMYEYIRQDPRFIYLKKHRRDIILAWVQREYKNLMRAHEAKIRSPQPLGIRNNVLVEEFIGKESPAPQLKDQHPKNPQKFFELTIKQIQLLYQAGLIHGDLSSFNILNDQEKPCIIDFSQATVIRTPNSSELLLRDLKNVTHFFRKLGIKADAEKLLEEIQSARNT